MSPTALQGWHVPLLVTALLLVLQWIVDKVIQRVYAGRAAVVPPPAGPADKEEARVELAGKYLRIAVLLLVGCVAAPVFVVSLLGPTLADSLAGVIGTILSGVTLYLAWLTRTESKKLVDLIEKLPPRAERTPRALPPVP